MAVACSSSSSHSLRTPCLRGCRSEARSLPQLLLLLAAQLVNFVYQIKTYRLLTSVARWGTIWCYLKEEEIEAASHFLTTLRLCAAAKPLTLSLSQCLHVSMCRLCLF